MTEQICPVCVCTIGMANQADKLITMGCGVEEVCAATFVETEDWELEDPKGKTLEEIRRIRGEIRTKVVDLLTQMEHSGISLESKHRRSSC